MLDVVEENIFQIDSLCCFIMAVFFFSFFPFLPGVVSSYERLFAFNKL